MYPTYMYVAHLLIIFVAHPWHTTLLGGHYINLSFVGSIVLAAS